MSRYDPIMNNEVYHVYNRGNNRMTLFPTPREYEVFLDKLLDAARRWSVAVIAYVLMPNHYHFLLLQRPGGRIPPMMHSLATSTAKRYNLTHRHAGHVFQDTYHHTLVERHNVAHTARYIHLNPVRAGLTESPEGWPYSSFADLVSVIPRSPSGLISPDLLIEAAGGSVAEYVEYVHAGMREAEPPLK